MQPHIPLITSDRGVLINGGQFIQNHYHGQISVGNKAPIDILTEAVAPSALHDSGATFDKPKCHPRTRVKIREIIMRWIVGNDEDAGAGKQFMWLNGAAGCGKSAISQSTIESCIEQGLPLASFFFNKSDSTRNHAGSLIATLAYQLYRAFRGTDVQKEILSAIQEDPLIFKKTIQQQFTSLIIRPLMTHFSKDPFIQQCVPFLIIIDGLDECTDRTAQKVILTGLAESLRNSNLYIPIFVASRPEHDIKLSFGSKSLKDIHTALSLDLEYEDASSDIRLYLFDRFATIKDDFDNRTTGRKLAQDWPGDEVIDTLVWKSSQQFIYAATVIRYVESTRHRPDHRLDVVLNLRPANGEHPFAHLDSLYTTILESALDIEKVLHALSLYLMDALEHMICCSVVEKFLSYDEGEVETLFCDMGALVQVYERGDQLYLRFLHASFREYLVDAARSEQFYINVDYEIIRHASHALQYLALCCSISLNPGSIADTAMYILREMKCQMAQRTGQITISLELRQAALSFPTKEFLKPHTSTHTYRKLPQNFVTPFLELMEAMVINDPTLSYIQDHQLGILRSVLMQHIQQYFNDDEQASILVLFYHTGSHRFVPILPIYMAGYPFNYYSNPFYIFGKIPESDILSLSYIWLDSNCLLGDNVYHRFVRQLLCDTLTCQTTEYTQGPIIYARAALACFKVLARRVWLPPPMSPSGKNIDIALIPDDAEDDTHVELRFWPMTDNAKDNACANLVFDSLNGGQWKFAYNSGAFRGEYSMGSDLCFLLLGYLIFLLPRCGRSDALVTACKASTWLPEDRKSHLHRVYNLFPVRRRLFHKEINKYLARVSPNII
ncbi:hypothetical protein CPC08DRAFT_759757 [Agrocybe pediades]|nr:hypothetical protein CPC08DRAFT_759757 [Agrocybe pediades]